MQVVRRGAVAAAADHTGVRGRRRGMCVECLLQPRQMPRQQPVVVVEEQRKLGVRVLQPGESLSAQMTIEVERIK